MGTSEVWGERTAARYDEDAAAMYAPQVLDPAVELLAELAGDGRVLEFAVGTGRVAVPLHRRGIPVAGIELSEPMLRELRRKASEDELPVVLGDMADATVPGAFRLVYLVWNTLSNLRTQAEQVACFRNASRHLEPGGRFVIELWVPPLQSGAAAVLTEATMEHVCYDTYDVASQSCTSHHFFREPDGSYRSDEGSFRYAWPSECDLMAQLAGLELEARYGDWDRRPFTAESSRHISIWRKPA